MSPKTIPVRLDSLVPGQRERRHRAFVFAAILVGLTAIGALLRFQGLAARDFWFDESCTFIYVHNLFSWPEDSSLLAQSTNLPYYVALRGWLFLIGMFSDGESEAAYRSLSALASSLVIPALGMCVYRMSARGKIFGAQAGLVCAALVAFHPLHIHYAHEARAYALWTLVLSIMLWLLFEASVRDSCRKRWWAAYGFVLLACLHLHYFTLYWIPSSVVCVLLCRQSRYEPGRSNGSAGTPPSMLRFGSMRRILLEWTITHTIIVLAFVPYFFAAVLPAARAGGGAWLTPHFEPLTAIPKTLWAFMPAGAYPMHLRGLSVLSVDTVATQPGWLVVIGRILPALVVVSVLCFLIRSAIRKPAVVSKGDANAPSDGRSWPLYVFAGGLTLLPLVLAWCYSLLIRPNYLVARYDLIAWPACMVLLALVISDASRRVAGRRAGLASAGVCAVLVACSLVPITRMAALQPPPTLHHVRAQRLAELALSDDLVITFSYDGDHLAYYLHRARFAGATASYPSWLDRRIGWVDTQDDFTPEREVALNHDAETMCDRIQAAIASGRRVWLLADSISPGPGGPRGEINQRLFDAIARAPYLITPVDSQVGLFQVHEAVP